MSRQSRHLALERHHGFRGGLIAPHRAIRTLDLEFSRVALTTVVSLGLMFIWLLLWNPVADAWIDLQQAILDAAQIPARAEYVPESIGPLFELHLPHIAIESRLPTNREWWIGLAVWGVVLLASLLLQRRSLPIAFALRLLCLVHASALFFFRTGRAFPYAIVDYTQVLQTAGMMVIGLVPLLYGMTFYPLDFSRGRKLAITLTAMTHLVVFVPLQYLLHALLLHHLSLLYMPLLFWAFGLTVDVFIVIAFYGWAASWQPLPYRHHSWWIPLRPILPAAAAVLMAMLLLGFAAKAIGQEPDWEHELRAGASYGKYDSDLGSLNGQFLRWTASRRFQDLVRTDVGRAERFGEEGFGFGAGWQHHLRQDTSVSFGASTGTGDVLFPRWRADVGLEHGVLPGDPLLLGIGYTHIQSKAENRSDGFGLNARWYGNAPWIFSGFGRIERGHPGDTISRSAGVGAMLHFPGRYSLGAGVEVGETSYVLLTPDEAAVDFDSVGWRLGASKELNQDWGVGARFDSFTSDVYDLWAIGIELYRRW